MTSTWHWRLCDRGAVNPGKWGWTTRAPPGSVPPQRAHGSAVDSDAPRGAELRYRAGVSSEEVRGTAAERWRSAGAMESDGGLRASANANNECLPFLAPRKPGGAPMVEPHDAGATALTIRPLVIADLPSVVLLVVSAH